MADITPDQKERLKEIISEMKGEIISAKADISKIKEIKKELLTA